MIKYREPLSMTESLEFIEDKKDSEAEIKQFIKKFVKLKPADGKKLRAQLNGLNLIKLKQEFISKIIDIMPENKESLNKIFIEVSLDEDESKKILDVLAEFR
jgi:DNA-directed RNA polymerase subunit F